MPVPWPWLVSWLQFILLCITLYVAIRGLWKGGSVTITLR
jgi:hypothetical protein